MSARDILQAAAGAGGVDPSDPNFNQTVLLLHGDGNQGANNLYNPGPTKYLAFSDNSSNNFPITVNGDAYGTNVSPYQNHSYYFNGSSYINVPDSDDFNLAAGDFTIEFWLNVESFGTDGAVAVVGQWSVSDRGWNVYVSPGNITFSYTTNGSSFVNLIATPTVALNTWHSICITRSSGFVNIYLNGTRVGNPSIGSATIWNSSRVLHIGTTQDGSYAPMRGYISNLRLIKGEALRTGTSYTVSTEPLTAVTNTVLLTCMAGYFGDINTQVARKTLTLVGTPTISSRIQPFMPTPNDNGSGYFDGSGDYLTAPSDTVTTLSGDFTIEYWVYRPASGNNFMFTLGDSFTSTGIETYIGSSGGAFILYSGGASRISSGTLPAVGAWNHVAVSRSGSTITLYLNGASLGTWSSSATFSGITYIGAERYNNTINGTLLGYLADLRIVKGRAVYTSAFTPPTAPLGVTSGGTNPPQGTETSLLTCQYSGSVRNVGFIDSSPNYFPITRVGNTTQGTFSPFSLAAGEWSNYFDTSGDSLTVPYSSTLALGTGDCTIEAWIYLASYPQQFNNIVDVRESSGSYLNNAISFGVENDGTLTFYAGSYSSATHVLETAAGKIALNAWYHVALTRASGTTKLYVNGVEEASSSNAWNQTSGTATTLYIGNAVVTRQVNGHISNLRIVKGRAVYTSAFSPSASPLGLNSGGTNPPQGTETVLLTCQQNRFVAAAGGTITRNGDVRVTPFSPFAPSAAYDPAVNGGSMYQGGSGNYLTTTNAVGVGLGTQTWTVSCWIYAATACHILSISANTSNVSSISFDPTTNGLGLQIYTSGYNRVLHQPTNVGIKPNEWNHIALCHLGSGQYQFYVNGVALTATGATGWYFNSAAAGTTTGIGVYSYNNTGSMTGYMSDLVVKNGIDGSVPTAPITTPATGTQLLLNFRNAGIFDQTGKNNLETVGNAQIDTSVKKFGTGSMKFDGTGDYLTSPYNLEFNFGTGNLTIECWAYWNSVTTGILVATIDSGGNSSGGFLLYLSASGTLRAYGPSVSGTVTTSVATGQWYHIALTRSGNTWTLWKDGTSQGTFTDTGTVNPGSTRPLSIGGYVSGSSINGFIDDLRITKGVARYPSQPFPTAPFPDK